MPFSAIDLFCGCGGLSCGFTQEGFQVLAGVDLNANALKTYSRNFPDALTQNRDLSELPPSELRQQLGLEPGELDCMFGGPPCQGFSKNVTAGNRYMEDPRNGLMRVFVSFVREFMPRAVLIENVAEVVNAYGKKVSDGVVEELTDLGYTAEVRALNAAHFGVPQFRRRAFFLASRTGGVRFPPPTHEEPTRDVEAQPGTLFPAETVPYVTVWDAISDLPSISAGAGDCPCTYASAPASAYQRIVRNGHGAVHDHVARPLTAIQLERVRSMPLGGKMRDLPDHLRPRSGYSGAYARLLPDEPARTITRWVFHPGSGRFSHPYDDRVITIREAARIQSFPDWFVFTGTYIQKSWQVGEAVPPLLVRHLARALAIHLVSAASPGHRRPVAAG